MSKKQKSRVPQAPLTAVIASTGCGRRPPKDSHPQQVCAGDPMKGCPQTTKTLPHTVHASAS